MNSDNDLTQQPKPIQPQPAEAPKTINFPAPPKKYTFMLGIYLLLVAPTFYALLDAQKVFGIDVDSWYIGWKLFSVTFSAIIFWIALSRKKMLWFCILLIPFFLLTTWSVFIDFITLSPIRLEVYFCVILVTIVLLLSSRKYYTHFMAQTGDAASGKSSRTRHLAITILAFVCIIALTTGIMAYLLELKKWPVTPQSAQRASFKFKKSPPEAFLTITAQPTKDLSATWPTLTQASPTPVLVTYRSEKLGFEFKHDAGYHVMEETANKVSFGFTVPDLTISINQNIDYKSYRLCNETNKQSPCLESGERWGQQGAITETTLGKMSAKSFYIIEDSLYRYNPYTPPHTVYHIVQTNDSPKIEAKMRLSNSGPEAFDSLFKQMLSTFKILDIM
jgi:hypothetical protein